MEGDNQDKFGGDYDKAVTAHSEAEKLLGQKSSEIQNLNSQVSDLQSQLKNLQASSPPTDSGEEKGGSIKYDWEHGKMRDDNGNIDQGLLQALGSAGASPQIVESMVRTIETAGQLVETKRNDTIKQTVGGQEQLESLLSWAGDNLPGAKVTTIQNLIGDINTMDMGIKLLQDSANESGFETKTTKAESNEPRPLPKQDSGTGTGGGLTPLIPNSPEALKAFADPRYARDETYREEVLKRLQLGMKH